jgi:hypothetical protein
MAKDDDDVDEPEPTEREVALLGARAANTLCAPIVGTLPHTHVGYSVNVGLHNALYTLSH